MKYEWQRNCQKVIWFVISQLIVVNTQNAFYHNHGYVIQTKQ